MEIYEIRYSKFFVIKCPRHTHGQAVLLISVMLQTQGFSGLGSRVKVHWLGFPTLRYQDPSSSAVRVGHSIIIQYIAFTIINSVNTSSSAVRVGHLNFVGGCCAVTLVHVRQLGKCWKVMQQGRSFASLLNLQGKEPATPPHFTVFSIPEYRFIMILVICTRILCSQKIPKCLPMH